MFSSESPHRGDSYEYTQYTIFNIKNKITLNHPKSAAMRYLPGIQQRIQISRGKRAISGRATEVLLYQDCYENYKKCFVFLFVRTRLRRITWSLKSRRKMQNKSSRIYTCRTKLREFRNNAEIFFENGENI